MSQTILINITELETRVAIVENNVVQEVYIESLNNRSLIGNIYKGTVASVLPGMQAAFVDIGLERTGFLHISDLYEATRETKITSILKENQEILVQIHKDPINKKGARLTTKLSIPSRMLVLLPNEHDINISAKIKDEAERQRLNNILEQERSDTDGMGYILRTSAEDATDLTRDYLYLNKVWSKVTNSISDSKSGTVLHQDLSLPLRICRDFINVETKSILIDEKSQLETIKKFIEEYIPEFEGKIEYHDRKKPIFDLFAIDDVIKNALQKKVTLKSGGSLIIEQTEAMTTIDVNTGKFIGDKNPEDTVFQTNLEAVFAIAFQIRLRNISGIIIVDFIDMELESNKNKILTSLQSEVSKDPTKTIVSQMSELGLVQMTRKRTRESLLHSLYEKCFTCKGDGYISTVETVCSRIMLDIHRVADHHKLSDLLVIASSVVIEELQSHVKNLKKTLGIEIELQVDALFAREQYDVVLL